MSLINFHRLLITTGILFCAGYGGWELWAYLQGASVWAVVLAVVFFVLAALLTAYLRHLNRFVRIREEEGDGASSGT